MTLVRRRHLVLALPLLAVAFLALASPSDDGPTICPFALFTGMACPGCGMTRAASLLVRGDLGQAMAYHPLVPFAALAVIGGWAWLLLRMKGGVGPISNRALNVALIGSAAALLAVWAARLATGTLPPV